MSRTTKFIWSCCQEAHLFSPVVKEQLIVFSHVKDHLICLVMLSGAQDLLVLLSKSTKVNGPSNLCSVASVPSSSDTAEDVEHA